jgi:hypothetical protein
MRQGRLSVFRLRAWNCEDAQAGVLADRAEPDKNMRSNSIKTRSTSPKVVNGLDRDGRFKAVSAGATFEGRPPKKLAAVTNPASAAISVNRAPDVPSIRTSQMLREILTKNPTAKHFTVKQIVDSIGESRVETSLIFFSIPGMLPVPGTSKLCGIPAGLIAGQMIAGRTQIKLPQFILRRSVPRRSLAVAIYAILPVLEMAEKAAKPRQLWASHPAVQRALGVFILLLALVIALPIFGFNVAHAASIFIISLGLAEQDGLAILIGVLAGFAPLILLTGASFSVKALHFGAVDWMKRMLKKVGLKWAAKLGSKWAAKFLKKRSLQWTTLLLLEWAELLLDPQALSRINGNKPTKHALKVARKGSAVRRGQKLARPSVRRSQVQATERPSVTKRSALSIQR